MRRPLLAGALLTWSIVAAAGIDNPMVAAEEAGSYVGSSLKASIIFGLAGAGVAFWFGPFEESPWLDVALGFFIGAALAPLIVVLLM